jgi:hypothetical protein
MMTPRERTRAWYLANTEKAKTASKARYEAKKKEILAKQKVYCDANREEIRARDRKYHEEDWRRRPFFNSRSRAKRDGLSFDLSLEDIVTPKVCPWFGIPLLRAKERTDNSPSLDRLVPSKGYVRGNVIVVSDLANRIKNSGTLEQIQAVADGLRKTSLLG